MKKKNHFSHCFPDQKHMRLGNRNCNPCRNNKHKECYDKNEKGKTMYEDGMYCTCSCTKCHEGSYTVT